MSNVSYTTAFTVAQTPAEVFAAINNVRAWWSGQIDGPTDAPNATFTYRYSDVHRSVQRIIEFTPDRRVVWHVVDGYLAFAEDKSEWTDTDIIFDITTGDAGTELRFTHAGLDPDFECFDVCTNAWRFYIRTSLRDSIAAGAGRPNPVEAASGREARP
jgi:hypothetical protein